MATKKVVLNGQTLIDLTTDTVEEQYVVEGKSFHGRDGEICFGTYRPKLQNLTISENGVYAVPEGVDGYGELTVEVSSGSVDPSMKPTLVPPTISITQETSTLTITDSYNDHHTEAYDIYLNGLYELTVTQPTVKMASYFELLDTTQISVTARAESFNTSERSNTVLWRIYTPLESTSGRLTTPNTPYINGAKKTLAIPSDNNGSSYTGGYRVYCNGVEIMDVPFENRGKALDISEFVDYSIDQYFQTQAYVKTGSSSSYTKDSLLSGKRQLIIPSEKGSTGVLNFAKNTSTVLDKYYSCTGFLSSVATEELPTELEIPNYYDSGDEDGMLPVRYVGGFGGKAIKKVKMHMGIVYINSSAFGSCTSLEEIEFAPTTSYIYSSAFYGCSKLTSISLPKALTRLSECCFQSCTALNHVDFGECKNNVTVYYYVFQNCPKLTALHLNEASLTATYNTSYSTNWYGAVTELYYTSEIALCRSNFTPYQYGADYLTTYWSHHPFYNRIGKIYLNNEEITALELPDMITSIGQGCFYNCSNISTISLNKVKEIGACAFARSSIQAVFTTDALEKINQSAFGGCTSLISFDFKIGLTNISADAFYNCTKLKFSTLPSSLKTLGSRVFYNNDALTEVFLPSSISSMGDSLFSGCNNLIKVNIPILVTTLGSVFLDCTSLSEVTLHSRITTLSATFSGCISLEELELPDNITTINSLTFSGCSKLNITHQPSQLLTISNQAFQNCAMLSKVEIPDGVISVGDKAFDGCTSLTEINIGKSVQTFSNNVLLNCKNLARLTVHSDNKTFYAKDNVLYNKSTGTIVFSAPAMEMETLELDYASAINSYAFQFSKVKNVIPASGLLTIGSYAFEQSGIEHFEFVPTIKTINTYAFANCRNLVSVQLPNSVTSLGTQCFINDSNLKTIYFGTGLTSIPTECCRECTALIVIDLPETITTYNNHCFYNCFSTENVVLPSTTTSIGTYAFYKVNLGSIRLPNATTNQQSFGYANIRQLDLRGLTKNISYEAFYVANIETLYFTENEITVNYNGFASAKIGDLYLTGIQPKGTYYNNTSSNYSWQSAVIERLYIYNLSSWMSYDSPYNTGLYQAKEKYILDANDIQVTDIELTTTGSWTFYKTQYFKNIERLTINGSYLSIPTSAFLGWSSLNYLLFDKPYTTGYNWNNNSSSDSSNLFYGLGTQGKPFTLEIGPTVKGIPQYFTYVLPCTNIIFSEGSTCTGIASYGFSRSRYLRNIELPKGLSSIGTCAFYQCPILENCKLAPETNTSIGQEAFEYCFSLKEIDLTEVTSWGTYAFRYCYGLLNVQLPKGLTTVPSYSFYQCYSLSAPDLTGYVTIGSYAFYGCASLRRLFFPETITSIGQEAFRGCTGLCSVILGAGLTSINSNAFYECPYLYEVRKHPDCPLSIVKGNSSNGYVAFYAKEILTPDDESIYFKEGIFTCYCDSSNKYYLINYEGDEVEDLIIPDLISGKEYTLHAWAFSGKSNLKTIAYPDRAFSIPANCFYGCRGLETVNIPEQITNIGGSAFNNCIGIKQINYAAKNITVSDTTNRFLRAGYLDGEVEVNVKTGVKYLPTLFRGSVNKTNLYSDSSVKITKINFENISECQTFGTDAFLGVPGPLEVHVTELAGWLTATFNDGEGNPLYVPEAKLIINNPSEGDPYTLEELEVPTNIFSIKNYVFYGYDQLTKVNIGDHVTSVGNYAFYDNNALSELYLGKALTSIGSQAFYGCEKLQEIYYNAEQVSSTNTVFNNFSGSSTNPTILTISSNVRKFPASLCSEMGTLEQVVFEENLNGLQVGNTAFPTSGVKKVYTSSLENWFSFSFSNNRSNPLSNLSAGLYVVENEEEKLITEVEIPLTVTNVSPYVFFKYKELKSVSIHKDLLVIGINAFNATPNLESIEIDPENALFIEEQGMLMPINKETIYGTDKNYIGDIELPSELRSIPAYCFYNRTNITQVIIPETVTDIGEYAFHGCSYLTKINLPESLTTLGNYAFYGCVRMEELVYNCINLGSMSGKNYCFYRLGYNNRSTETGLTFKLGPKVERIADYLFTPYSADTNYCACITKVDSRNNFICTTIGIQSFYYCYYLTEIDLPQSITTIGSYAFYYNQFISFPELKNLTTIRGYAFYYCNKLLEIVLKEEVSTIENYAFYYCSNLTVYAEAASKPGGWQSSWLSMGGSVIWGYLNYDCTYSFVTNVDDIELESITTNKKIQLPILYQEDLYLWGWYTTEDFSGEIWYPNQFVYVSQIAETDKITFYARWEDSPNGTGASFDEARHIGVNQQISVTFPAYTQINKYFVFTAKETKTYSVSASASYRTRVYVYESTNSSSSITSNSNVTSNGCSISCSAGKSYVLRFYPYSNSYTEYLFTFKIT